MNKYNVIFSYTSGGSVLVDADNIDKAIDLVNATLDNTGVPNDADIDFREWDILETVKVTPMYEDTKDGTEIIGYEIDAKEDKELDQVREALELKAHENGYLVGSDSETLSAIKQHDNGYHIDDKDRKILNKALNK